jgi:hypothetical protein
MIAAPMPLGNAPVLLRELILSSAGIERTT